MPKGRQKARPIEAASRAVNATDWQPVPGMVKKRCLRCRYLFAVPIFRLLVSFEPQLALE